MSDVMWAIKDTYWLARRSILHIVRSLDQIMSLIAFPIMFMLLTRYVLGGVIKTGNISYANYLFAGILVQTLAFGANYTTINLAVDMKEGIVKRFRSLPMYNAAVVVGHIMSDLVRNIISGFLIILVGLLIGFRPNATFKEWVLVIVLGLLFTLAMSWLSAILGLLVNSLEAAQWVGFLVVLPLTFVSSSFVPISTFPTVLREFAERQPITYIIDTTRSWLVGTPIDKFDVWMAFIWCFVIIIVCVPVTAWLFKKRASKLGG
jgi:ABC-2 type transport system permease protein